VKALRWLLFCPVGFLLMGLAQYSVVTVAERMPFWVGAPLILFLGVIVGAASFIPCRIAPNPLIGASVLLSLFAVFELLSFPSFIQSAPFFPVAARLYSDVALFIGGVAAARIPAD